MKTYRVSYRVVANSQPNVSVILSYVVDALEPSVAQALTEVIMVEDAVHLFGFYDNDLLRRVTVLRVK